MAAAFWRHGLYANWPTVFRTASAAPPNPQTAVEMSGNNLSP
ncbi:hypothetical protein BOO71_0001735 [Deinococcus marmoris]|uniref:Uncharacterized protein n=1 Tax=Deinococcus marmoris TaxID=249408 RepID=A0A1U7P3Q8_9DEIO|nr:hypothetical protein BOO71_0001735 [Deinococcus marmoris]